MYVPLFLDHSYPFDCFSLNASLLYLKYDIFSSNSSNEDTCSTMPSVQSIAAGLSDKTTLPRESASATLSVTTLFLTLSSAENPNEI